VKRKCILGFPYILFSFVWTNVFFLSSFHKKLCLKLIILLKRSEGIRNKNNYIFFYESLGIDLDYKNILVIWYFLKYMLCYFIGFLWMISFMGHYWRSFVHLQNTPENDNEANLAYQLISAENYLTVCGKKKNVPK